MLTMFISLLALVSPIAISVNVAGVAGVLSNLQSENTLKHCLSAVLAEVLGSPCDEGSKFAYTSAR